MKIITNVSTSATNPYLDADMHLNVGRVEALNEAIQKKVGKNTDAKTTAVYRVSRKSKTAKYSAGKANKNDLKYLGQRALKVGLARRIGESSLIKNKPLLMIYDKETMGDALAAKAKMAASAINTHMKKADKTKTMVTKEKGKLRDVANKDFDASIVAFKKMLSDSGLDMDKALVESTGMMGKTVLLNLGGGMVVSIGKADMKRFKAAKAAV